MSLLYIKQKGRRSKGADLLYTTKIQRGTFCILGVLDQKPIYISSKHQGGPFGQKTLKQLGEMQWANPFASLARLRLIAMKTEAPRNHLLLWHADGAWYINQPPRMRGDTTINAVPSAPRFLYPPFTVVKLL